MAFEKNIFEGTENSSCSIGPTVTYTGHLRREKNWKCPSHFHECAEVLFCVDGRGSVTIDGKRVSDEGGEILLYLILTYQIRPGTAMKRILSFILSE